MPNCSKPDANPNRYQQLLAKIEGAKPMDNGPGAVARCPICKADSPTLRIWKKWGGGGAEINCSRACSKSAILTQLGIDPGSLLPPPSAQVCDYNKVLSRLPGVRMTDIGRWRAPCRCHTDPKASLDLELSHDGKLLLICRAGCKTKDILDAIGCRWGDLFPPGTQRKSKSGGRKVVATYQFRDETGKFVFEKLRYEPKGFSQRRPDGNGGWIYDLKGVPPLLYRLPELIAADPAEPVLIVEGEKDVERLRALGFTATTNPGGASKWRNEFNEFFRARPVVVIPDNDKPGLDHALEVARSLCGVAASVKILKLDGLKEKGDVSDWLDNGGTGDELRRLAEEAPIFDPSTIPTLPVDVRDGVSVARTPNEAPDDPCLLARLIRVARPYLRFFQGEFFDWDGLSYRNIGAKDLRADVSKIIKDHLDAVNLEQLKAPRGEDQKPPTVTKVKRNLINDVMDRLEDLAIVSSHREMPMWLGGSDDLRDIPPDELLATKTGLVHPGSLFEGKPCIWPPTPCFFSTNNLPYAFDLDAPKPIEWLRFLAQLWPDDQHSIATLQEFFGLCLMPDTRFQKILLIVGPSRSGKGTIAHVLGSLVGPHNVAGPTLAGLGTNFGLWHLLGKTVGIISDARLSGRTDTAIVTERLLSISGEDAITVDRKCLEPITVKLLIRFVILTNELPRLGDSSGALAGRFIVLRLTESFFGREDLVLKDRLTAEIEGILLWALEGLQRLRQNGRFIQPDSGRELLEDVKDLASPVSQFVRERCILDDAQLTPVQELFGQWKNWCDSKGRRETGTEATFGRDLRAAFSHLQVVRPRDGADRFRAYVGIGLRD